MKDKLIIGSGAAAMDTVIHCEGVLLDDGFSFIKKEWTTPGGSGANLITAVSHLGAKTAMVYGVGDDEYGRSITEGLIKDGVDTRFAVQKKGGVSLHTYCIVSNGGERTILVNKGNSCFEMSPEDIPDNVMENAELVYVDGGARAASAKLVRLAKEAGVPVFFQQENLAMDEKDSQEERDFRYILQNADLFSAGRDVYFQHTGLREHEAALRTVYERYKPRFGVVMTAGKKGAYWYDGKTLIYQPVYPVASVDSTGAGDAFCGGLAYAFFAAGLDKKAALSFAAACGAIKCTVPGPRLTKTAEEVNEFIRGNKI